MPAKTLKAQPTVKVTLTITSGPVTPRMRKAEMELFAYWVGRVKAKQEKSEDERER